MYDGWFTEIGWLVTAIWWRQCWNRTSVSFPQISPFDYHHAASSTTSGRDRLHFELHFASSTLGPDADGFYAAKSAFIWAHRAVGRTCFGGFTRGVRVAIAKRVKRQLHLLEIS